MKASIGTLKVLGLKECKMDSEPTTAYFLSEEECQQNCKFCAQSHSSKADRKMLSRVAWPNVEELKIIESLTDAYVKEKVKRTCLQVVNHPMAIKQAKEIIEQITNQVDIPICISSNVKSVDEVGNLIKIGVDKVSIALDAATPEIYEKIKGGSFAKRLSLLTDAAIQYPNRISTHLIVGLGETEQQILQLIDKLLNYNITVALFAFTPVRGTEMSDWPQPPIEQYRRVQVAFYLLKEGLSNYTEMKFNSQGQLINYGKPYDLVMANVYEIQGLPYHTTGCDDCNRPYYNEKPGGIMYNYPRPLTKQELDLAIYNSKPD